MDKTLKFVYTKSANKYSGILDVSSCEGIQTWLTFFGNNSPPPPGGDKFLWEDGSYILWEDSSKVLQN